MTPPDDLPDALLTAPSPLYLCVLTDQMDEKLTSQSRWRILSLDLTACRSKADFLERAAMTLKFPTWFGHNWDALSDCLTDMSWWPAGRYVIILRYAMDFCFADADGFNIALEILRDAALQQAEGPLPMRILVDLQPSHYATP